MVTRRRRRSAGALALVAAAVAAAGCTSAPASPVAGEVRIPVTLSAAGCQPTALSAPAGRIVFEVTNGGPDAAEFEVLSGTTVVDEVENIVPGFVVNFATRLDGGTYELICYSLQAPRGSLAVSGTAPPASNAIVDADPLAKSSSRASIRVSSEPREETAART